MKRSVAFVWAACGLISAAVLVACGGGGNSTSAPQSTSDESVHGVVVGGSLEGNRVFLDLNNNHTYDSGEPEALSQGDTGAFTLNVGVRTVGELASAMLVAEVSRQSKDPADEGLNLEQAGRGGFVLMSPASAFLQVDASGVQTARPAVISPLTTLVAGEVAFNGMTPAQAVEAVQRLAGLGENDPMSSYVAGRHVALQGIARASAVTLGEFADGETQRERVAAALAQLRARLPGIVARLNLGGGSSAVQVSVASVKNALADVLPATATPPAKEGAGGRFIVKLRDGVTDPREHGRRFARLHRGELRHSFARAMKGFAVKVPDGEMAAFLDAALRDPDVDHVEVDQVVATSQAVQDSATWGLDRTDQRDLPLNKTYSYWAVGGGVRAYVVDTGVHAAHPDFEGRVIPGFSALNDGQGTEDCNGHGTHVSGTLGGRKWGMAKSVTLVPVRVLGCDGLGYTSDVIAGLEWVASQPFRPAVANLSLGSGSSNALDAAVANVVNAGIVVTVAAGNSDANACNVSPSREPTALTVAASTNKDERASFSNFGTCVDIFAPGERIQSASIGTKSDTTVMSGTSMAAPHVAGLAAIYLQTHREATPAEVAAVIVAAATPGRLARPGAGSSNALLYADLSSVILPPVVPISGPVPPISSPEPPISSPVPPISAPEPPVVPSISVGALSGYAVSNSRKWQAVITVAVKGASNQLVPGVVVKGSFTAGGNKVSCKTAANGTCMINSGAIGNATQSTTFSVVSLSVSGIPYDPSLNTATSVTVQRN